MLDSFLVFAATDVEVELSILEMFGVTFGIDWKLILAQGINFLLVALLLWKFAFKPVTATMDARQKQISDGLQFAEEAKQQLSSAEKEKADKLREAHAEAQDIVREAKARADALAAEQKAQAELEIAERRARAEQSIEQERLKVLNEARQSIARLVVLTSGKVLDRELSADDRSRFNAAAAQEVANLN